MRIVSIVFLLSLLRINVAFSQAALFEPSIISNNKVFGATLTPDGNDVYFVASYGGRDTLQIFHSQKVAGNWKTPKLAFFADKNYRQIDPAVSPDGQTILFNMIKDTDEGFDVYAVYRTASGWTAPQRLSEAINSAASEFYATMALNKTIYFTRRTQSNDIYVSRFSNNQYQPAVPLDSIINTAKNESNPYIAPDESYLIFFADRDGGFGDSDLYISFRKDSRWSKPMNLGPAVNTAKSEFCPTVDGKGGYFYFSRTEEIDKKRVENIYRIKLNELGLHTLRQRATY